MSPFQVSNEARQPSGVLAVFRELLIAITFLVKSLLIQEYIFCCVSLHKSVFPPIYHPCCFSLNTLQRVSNLLIMMFSEPSASFQAQALSSPKDGLCLSAPWSAVSTYTVRTLPDPAWTHDSLLSIALPGRAPVRGRCLTHKRSAESSSEWGRKEKHGLSTCVFPTSSYLCQKKHSRGVSALCTKERRPRWVIHKLKWFFLLALIDTYGIQLSLSTGKMNFRRLKDLPTVTKHLAYKWDNLESQGFFLVKTVGHRMP